MATCVTQLKDKWQQVITKKGADGKEGENTLTKQERALKKKRDKKARKDARERSDAIERLNRAQQSRIANVVRILFLGTPRSGLSTIFKQMKLIHKTKLDDEDLAYYTRAVDITCLSSMLFLVHGCIMHGIPILGRVDEPPKQEKWLKLALDKILTFDGQVVPEQKAMELRAFNVRRAEMDALWRKNRDRQLRLMKAERLRAEARKNRTLLERILRKDGATAPLLDDDEANEEKEREMKEAGSSSSSSSSSSFKRPEGGKEGREGERKEGYNEGNAGRRRKDVVFSTRKGVRK